MMPVIRIADATWERMKRHARPLEDTPDDIVQRALDALDGGVAKVRVKRVTAGRPTKAETGRKLPQKDFREPLLLTLLQLEGNGSLAQIREAMLPHVKARLNSADYAVVSTGEPRWWNATCWERSELVKEGLFRSDSGRGRWVLSQSGRKTAEKLARNK